MEQDLQGTERHDEFPYQLHGDGDSVSVSAGEQVEAAFISAQDGQVARLPLCKNRVRMPRGPLRCSVSDVLVQQIFSNA